jgi:benzoyl-CoA 2,3-dioxygenase component A
MAVTVIKQHLIDPEICIRCNTCETMCPVGAITHDANNYVVDASKCNWCNDCISPCPTGSIDNYRKVPSARAYTLDEQFGWGSLPAELSAEELAAASGGAAAVDEAAPEVAAVVDATGEAPFAASSYGATLPPWSAAHAYTNLYGPKAAEKTVTATVVGQRARHRGRHPGPQRLRHPPHRCWTSAPCPSRCWRARASASCRRGWTPTARPHHARQYSIASPRNGERPGYNNLSLTVKRVLEDHQGRPVRGVASNYRL